MFRNALLVLSLLLSLSLDARADDISRSEYVRLSEKMEGLATKNAWSGVERTYRDLLQTGEPLSFDDFLTGAHSARALGDVTSARERLLECKQLKEDRRVIEWLFDIDSNYGHVSLKADPGTVALAPSEMPFDPAMASAVAFAQVLVQDSGTFEGYLPGGEYTFGSFSVRVRPRVTGERIDIRSDNGARSETKAAKKDKRKNRS